MKADGLDVDDVQPRVYDFDHLSNSNSQRHAVNYGFERITSIDTTVRAEVVGVRTGSIFAGILGGHNLAVAPT